jgi:hypothetical protein
MHQERILHRVQSLQCTCSGSINVSVPGRTPRKDLGRLHQLAVVAASGVACGCCIRQHQTAYACYSFMQSRQNMLSSIRRYVQKQYK